MPQIDPNQLTRTQAYQLLTATLIPRPIGWVSTIDATGIPNLAPFSFFAGVTSDPMTLMLSVGRRRGECKDTARNLLATGEAVVHIPHRPLAAAMVASSTEAPPEIDEFVLAQLATLPAERVDPPRIKDAAVAFECKMVGHQEVGRGPVDLFFLEVLLTHLADAFLDPQGLPDPRKLAAVGRLGGELYCDTREVFAMARPR